MQSIGERLEEARKRKGISIREAAEATKIRSDYLHKYESNEFDLNLPEIYVRGFLKNYATYLGVPADKISTDYQALSINEERGQRGVNREVYGRMDISAPAKASREGPAIAPPTQSQGSKEESPHRTVPNRTGSSIAGLERVLLLKTSTLAIIGLVLLLLVGWGLYAIFSKNTDHAAPALVAITQVRPGEETIDIITTGPASLTVTRKSDGTELYRSNGQLPVGFRLTLPKVTVTLETSSSENLQFDYRGSRTHIPNLSGPQNITIPLGQVR